VEGVSVSVCVGVCCAETELHLGWAAISLLLADFFNAVLVVVNPVQNLLVLDGLGV
jgi:hypothetical protein